MNKLFFKTSILTILLISQANSFAQKLSANAGTKLEIPPMEAYFPLDGGAGDIVKEEITELNGTLSGMQNKAETEAAWISSTLGGALRLDGMNDRVLVPHNPAFDFKDEDFSVSFFMRWKKGVEPHSQHIVCKGDYHSASPDQTGKRWEMYMSTGGVCFIIDDDVNKSQIRVPLDVFITGEWVHIVALRDTKNRQLRLYANGILQESTNPEKQSINGTDITGDISNPQRLTIGDAYLQDNPFPGDLDDLRIFRSVLSEKQIIDLASLMVEVKPTAANVKQDLSSIHLIPDFAKRPRIIVTSDGEIDDQCSMIRFMLYTNECDIEGIISSSSQYHAHGHKWAGDDWIDPDLDAYEKVYPNLVKHDPNYPTPEYLRSITFLGNVDAEGEMEKITEGSQHIVKVLLDESDHNPIWLQAWGGMNTIARALKTIQEEHPEKMAYVAKKMRFFFIWEQDVTYQEYIRPNWGKYNIPTIISDQFEAIAYRWKMVQPEEMLPYFEGPWMKKNILENHGPLCSIYAAYEAGKKKGFEDGDFRSEGDSPAFIHTIQTGLRNRENPSWGGWGGRYVRVRENTWLDPVPVKGYGYPAGRWSGANGWGRSSLRATTTSTPEQRKEYFKPMWRWTDVLQNDFASRADWCVKSYEEANHPPVVMLANKLDIQAVPGETINLSAEGTSDPDKDKLKFYWWQHQEADTYKGAIEINGANKQKASFIVPGDTKSGKTIHVICEVKDNGTPQLTRYQRVVIEIKNTQLVQKPDTAIGIPPMAAYFPLNKRADIDVHDVIGGLKGKLVNGDSHVAWISDGIDGAVKLDGMDDCIIVPNSAALDFGDESFSVLFWMRWPKGLPTGHEHILTKGDYESSLPGETGKRYEIYVSSGNLCFTIDDDIAKSLIQVSMEPYITGEWVHVAAIRDKKEKRLKLYANGMLQKTSSPGNTDKDGFDKTGNISNPRELFFGDASRLDAPYQGDLDDLRLFREALTDQQVAAIATKAATYEIKPPLQAEKKKRLPAKFDESTIIPPMEAHWTLDETSGSVVTDKIKGLKGTLKDADDKIDWIPGKDGGALHFDGKDNRLFVPNNPAFDFADESFSVSFIMRWPKERIAHHEHMIAKGDYASAAPDETGKRWEIIMASGKGLCFNIDDDVNKSQILVPFDAYTHGDWVHVVAVRDTKSKRLKLYADGVLQEASRPDNPRYDGIDRTGNISNPQQLIIGDSKRLDNPLEGEMDDIRIYRSALTDAQVAKLASLYGFVTQISSTEIPPMEAYWPLDDKSGTNVNEEIKGLNGRLKNTDPATAWVTGKLGGAIKFDGLDDRIIVPSNPAFDFGDEDFSVAFMMRWPKEEVPHNEHMLTKGDYSSNVPNETGKRWEITMDAGKGICFIIDDDANKSNILVPYDAFTTGEWVHVVAVRDTKNRKLKLYADGVLQKASRPDDPKFDGIDRTGSIANPQNLFIGDASRLDNPFIGEMDDIRIFRSALTDEQVANLASKVNETK